MDPTGKKDAKYVRTVRKTLLGLNLFGFVATDIDANEAIRRDVENNRNFRVANLQVTHGCFNDYGAVLTWFFTVPICKLQYDILEVTQ